MSNKNIIEQFFDGVWNYVFDIGQTMAGAMEPIKTQIAPLSTEIPQPPQKEKSNEPAQPAVDCLEELEAIRQRSKDEAARQSQSQSQSQNQSVGAAKR